MLQLLLFHLLLQLTLLGAALSLCAAGNKKKNGQSKSMSNAGTPGANGDMKTAIEGGGSEVAAGSKEGDGRSGRISIHGPVHESKESAEQVEGEAKVPSAETINMEKAAPGKVSLVSKEKV